jgi:hypothetical protein
VIRNGYMYVNTDLCPSPSPNALGTALGTGADCIKKIGQYCKKHDIFDMITIVDPFGLSVEEYMDYGFLKGTGYLNYYYYNLKVPKLSPKECGFVTI